MIDRMWRVFEDAAVGGDCLGQGGGVPVALQGPDQIGRADLAGVDGGDQPQDLTPVAPHLAQVEFPAGEGVQASVIGAVARPPPFLVGQVGQRGPVVDAQQARDPEDQVGIGSGVGDEHLGQVRRAGAEEQVDRVEAVPVGARHDFMPGPERLIVDHVQERHPALGAEVFPVGFGHQGRDGDDEPHAVDRGDHPAAQGRAKPMPACWAIRCGLAAV
jgi:hypothetical protein